MDVSETPPPDDREALRLAAIEAAKNLPIEPKRPGRKAWQEKAKAGRNRVGNPIPQPASPKEAKEMMKTLAIEATKAVVEGKKLNTEAVARYEHMSSVVRAHILSYLGEDIEKARGVFADELLSNARKAAQYLMDNFEGLPPSVQSFVFTAMVDKSELLRTKNATSAAGANVGNQVNVFCGGGVDKEAIIAQLTGAAFGLKPPAKNVTPVAEPAPPSSPPTSQ